MYAYLPPVLTRSRIQKLKTKPIDAVRKAVVRQIKLTIAGKVTTKMFFKLFERSVRADPEFAVDMLESVAEVAYVVASQD